MTEWFREIERKEWPIPHLNWCKRTFACCFWQSNSSLTGRPQELELLLDLKKLMPMMCPTDRTQAQLQLCTNTIEAYENVNDHFLILYFKFGTDNMPNWFVFHHTELEILKDLVPQHTINSYRLAQIPSTPTSGPSFRTPEFIRHRKTQLPR